MPTDEFEVADSQSGDYTSVGGARLRSVIQSDGATHIIDGIKAALLAAGWSEGTPTAPHTRATLPYGLPTAVEVDPPVADPKPVTNALPTFTIAWLDGDELKYRYWIIYNPYQNDPGLAAQTYYIEAQATVAATFLALVESISDFSDWDAVAYPDPNPSTGFEWLIDFAAKTPGTLYNHLATGGIGAIHGVPFWAHVEAQPGEGGWVLRSTSDSDEWLQVWIYLSMDAQIGWVGFKFESSKEGAKPTYYMPIASSTNDWRYTIIANQFQFCMFPEGDDASTEYVLLASMPYLQGPCEYAVIIVCNLGARQSMQWQGTNGIWSSARDGELSPVRSWNHGPGCFPGFYALRHFGGALKTSQGFPITESAFVGVPSGAADSVAEQSRVVGKLWDALIISDQKSLNDRMIHRNLQWQCVFNQAGNTRASVWIAYAAAP